MSARNYVPAMVKWMVEEGTKNTSRPKFISMKLWRKQM